MLGPGVSGYFDEAKLMVIAYDPAQAGLITVEDSEAISRNLRTILVDQYSDPDARFECPQCHAVTMQVEAVGH
jgi:hypothetical protein